MFSGDMGLEVFFLLGTVRAHGAFELRSTGALVPGVADKVLLASVAFTTHQTREHLFKKS